MLFGKYVLKKEQYGSWQEVANVLNQRLHRDYSEACYRKAYEYWNLMDSAIKKCVGDDDSVGKELEIQKRELEKERKKLQTDKLNIIVGSEIMPEKKWCMKELQMV